MAPSHSISSEARLLTGRVAGRARDASTDTVFGLCICGGLSRRMGQDKAELLLGDRTLLARAVATLSEIASEVVLATGSAERYAALGCRVALDRYADAGPLAGLEAGLTAVRDRLHDMAGRDLAVHDDREQEAFVVVLPCDMPRADSRLLRALLERAVSEARPAACLLAGEEGPEPLCGVYHTSALASIRSALDAGERKVLSFMRHPGEDGELPRMSSISATELSSGRSTMLSTLNVNTRADLSAERERHATEASA